MEDTPIWRYMSLSKYIHLLSTKSLYFPRASQFQDKDEGKWYGHTTLYEDTKLRLQIRPNIKTLEDLLERGGEDPATILSEVNKLIPTANEWVRKILYEVQRGTKPDKRRAIIEDTISVWKKMYAQHPIQVRHWIKEAEQRRESTYISCWNRAPSLSLAMWSMYGGEEAIAVQSTESKLNTLIEDNAPLLQAHGLLGSVAKVEYVEGLKNPDKKVHERLYHIVFENVQDYRIGLFSIKPSIFYFEEEVRAIIYKSDEIPNTDVSQQEALLSISPLFGGEQFQGESKVTNFIEKVYIHPLLGENSIIFKAVTEINKLFGVDGIPVEADRMEAFGENTSLPPA